MRGDHSCGFPEGMEDERKSRIRQTEFCVEVRLSTQATSRMESQAMVYEVGQLVAYPVEAASSGSGSNAEDR
jgi:hypothetical protein